MKKVLIGCLGTTVLTLVVLVAVVWYVVGRNLPVLEVAMSLPLEAEMESTVPMVIMATNTHNAPITLDSIDIDDSFLAGFQVVSIDPRPDDTSHLGICHQRTWGFGKPVAPGASLSVTFLLKPVAEGRFAGDIDVCNANQDFKTLLADVVVKKQVPKQP